MAWTFAWIVSKRQVTKTIPGWSRSSQQKIKGEYYTHYTSGSDEPLETIREALKNRKDIIAIVDSTPETRKEKRGRRKERKVKKQSAASLINSLVGSALRGKAKTIAQSRVKYDYPDECNTPEKKSAYRRMMRKKRRN